MKGIERQLWKENAILIYGAHLTALECARWLVRIGAKDKISGFAVTDRNGNPEMLMGFPVKTLDEYGVVDQDTLVLLALPEKYHKEVETYICSRGFCRFLKVGLEKMSEWKGNYLIENQKEFPVLPFVLKRDIHDPCWLNMVEKPGKDDDVSEKIKWMRHYKFPTLFYLNEEKMIEEARKLHFYEDYESICGAYRNLHLLADGVPLTNNREIKKILKVFMAFSSWDNKTAKAGREASWICPIQVGSSLSEQKSRALSDDTGDHISPYNGLFAEMTGAYWIWKNEAFSEYKGLCHYRRHFLISEGEILALRQNKIDVILPTPRYVPGGIRKMFLAETPVQKEVFENMLCSVSELYGDEREQLEVYLESCFYYPNNMVIARRNIYDDYCSYVFPILFRMREMDMETDYGHETDRHIAYASELLTSFYFVKYKELYRIVVTDYEYRRDEYCGCKDSFLIDVE